MKKVLLPRVIGAEFTCNICNQDVYIDKIDMSSPLYEHITKHHICKQCAFWKDIIDNGYRNKKYMIIKGVLYKKPPEDISNKTDRFIYVLFNNLSVTRMKKIIKVGVIPQRFRDKLQDNAHFVDKKIYSMLRNNDFKCLKKGCYDRYHCIRYDKTAERNGAWNVIPKSHKVGDEKCPSFINKSIMA